MTDPTPDRPLVTFALFAYNQEQYIREAVEGAFSQTYEPLEIILSDDCSSDRTFEIMQEMATAYEGPHEVRVVKTEINLGITRHFLLRCREAKGEIVVVAAGDDVSKPQRCQEHVAEYADETVMGVSGSYDLIDEVGDIISLDNCGPILRQANVLQPKLFSAMSYSYVVIQGSTASYRRSIFRLCLPDGDLGCSEDNLLNFLIYANGFRVVELNLSLVRYRRHNEAISNRESLKLTPELHEARFRAMAETQIARMRAFRIIAKEARNGRAVNISEIERREKSAQDMLDWSQFHFGKRLTSFIESIFSLDFEMAKWKLARILGRFPNYQPKKIISNRSILKVGKK